MASVSYSLTVGNLEGHEMEPDKIAVAANAPGAGDIELRVNTANIPKTHQIVRAMKAFIRRAEDGRLGPNDFKSI